MQHTVLARSCYACTVLIPTVPKREEEAEGVENTHNYGLKTFTKAGAPFMRLHCACILNRYMYIPIAKAMEMQCRHKYIKGALA